MGRKKKHASNNVEEDDDVDFGEVAKLKLQESLRRAKENLENHFSSLQVGRASPDLLSKIQVDAYGSSESLQRLAQVTVKDAQNLVINVFDPSLVKSVADAILKADLNLSPQVIGSTVKVTLPRVTAEYRERLAKEVQKMGEDSKVVVRKHRQDVLNSLRKKKDDFSKDALFKLEEDLTKMTNDVVKKIGELSDRKANEVKKKD